MGPDRSGHCAETVRVDDLARTLATHRGAHSSRRRRCGAAGCCWSGSVSWHRVRRSGSHGRVGPGTVDRFPGLLVLVVGGIVEGAALGGAQALVLRRVLPGFRVNAWVGATAGAAGFAWLLGMLPSATHSSWSTWPPVMGRPGRGCARRSCCWSASGPHRPWSCHRATARPFAWVWMDRSGLVRRPGGLHRRGPAPVARGPAAAGSSSRSELAGGAVMAFTMAAVTGWAW